VNTKHGPVGRVVLTGSDSTVARSPSALPTYTAPTGPVILLPCGVAAPVLLWQEIGQSMIRGHVGAIRHMASTRSTPGVARGSAVWCGVGNPAREAMIHVRLSDVSRCTICIRRSWTHRDNRRGIPHCLAGMRVAQSRPAESGRDMGP